ITDQAAPCLLVVKRVSELLRRFRQQAEDPQLARLHDRIAGVADDGAQVRQSLPFGTECGIAWQVRVPSLRDDRSRSTVRAAEPSQHVVAAPWQVTGGWSVFFHPQEQFLKRVLAQFLLRIFARFPRRGVVEGLAKGSDGKVTVFDGGQGFGKGLYGVIDSC